MVLLASFCPFCAPRKLVDKCVCRWVVMSFSPEVIFASKTNCFEVMKDFVNVLSCILWNLSILVTTVNIFTNSSVVLPTSSLTLIFLGWLLWRNVPVPAIVHTSFGFESLRPINYSFLQDTVLRTVTFVQGMFQLICSELCLSGGRKEDAKGNRVTQTTSGSQNCAGLWLY